MSQKRLSVPASVLRLMIPPANLESENAKPGTRENRSNDGLDIIDTVSWKGLQSCPGCLEQVSRYDSERERG